MKKLECEVCGKEISEEEYERNYGLCDECDEDEELEELERKRKKKLDHHADVE